MKNKYPNITKIAPVTFNLPVNPITKQQIDMNKSYLIKNKGSRGRAISIYYRLPKEEK